MDSSSEYLDMFVPYSTLTVSGNNVTMMGETMPISAVESNGARLSYSGGTLTVVMTDDGETATYRYRKSYERTRDFVIHLLLSHRKIITIPRVVSSSAIPIQQPTMPMPILRPRSQLKNTMMHQFENMP